MALKELEDFLHKKIPSAKAMGVELVYAGEDRVEIKAPLKPNINHVGTAFGGSLNSIMLLTCYAWFLMAVEKRGHHFHILLKSSTAEYLLPVGEEIHSICKAPSEKEIKNFLDVFEKKGKGRLQISSYVQTKAGVACKLTGEFVATKAKG